MNRPQRISRREFAKFGLSAVATGLAFGGIPWGLRSASAASGIKRFVSDGGWTPLGQAGPFLNIAESPSSVLVEGLPFHAGWFGDDFGSSHLPFHICEDCALPPAATTEEVDVAIIGGGLAGLAAAWHLRDHAKLAVLDLRPRMGGNAMGERWRGIPYSLGSAYFMVPDKGSALEQLYNDLGVYRHARIDPGDGFRIEYGGQIIEALCDGCTPEQRRGLARYQAAVAMYAGDSYPEIPLAPSSRDVTLRLDQRTFAADVLAVCGGHVPPMLARALQAYCYSSFGVGWDQLSAAAGWNFVAAEEYGRIVLPGGNAGLAQLFVDALRPYDQSADEEPGRVLRAGCRVVHLRLVDNRGEVTFVDPHGVVHLLRAQHVIVAGSKHIVRQYFPQLEQLDPQKWDLIPQVENVAYLVANALLSRQAPVPFYDMFLIHDAAFPMNDNEFAADRRITDVVDGSFASVVPSPVGDVLTMYWPLPWHTARFTIIDNQDWESYARLGAKQIRRMLRVTGLKPADLVQVRMTRWGHAMPFLQQGQLSSGLPQILSRPVADRVWFVNQDNWLLPAVETCLQEAKTWTNEIIERL